ncbi:hypothetical protein ABW636_22435 [Aquimarina sp. 2201CG1-2-11]|uniref:hypothetical protein n=1 Tax=Aquimarina discodermiae TaxID=3231043 RepID=UPI0034631517
MKKLFYLFTIILLVNSCDNVENPNQQQPEISFETKNVTVNISLPENSSLNVNNLTVSSLFTHNNQIINNESTVELFDENAIELVYVTNENGKIVLMNLINPSKTEEISLNSASTAKSLIMFHPWVMHLSVEAREEAYNEISLLPEFSDYHNLIIQGINSGEIDPLATQDILGAIDNLQNSMLSRVEIERAPLTMVVENNNVKVTNEKNSLAYSLQLFDEGNTPVGNEYIVDGVNREIYSWSTVSNILTGNFDLFHPQDVNFQIPTQSQMYTLKADTWSGSATFRNGSNIASSLIGIFSTTLKKVFKLSDCAFNVGSYFYSNVNVIIQQLTSNQLSSSQTISQMMSFLANDSNNLYDIIQKCPGNYSIGSEAFNQTIKALSIIGNLENGTLLFFNLIDLQVYDSEIEFCFLKTSNDIVECDISVVGKTLTLSVDSFCINGTDDDEFDNYDDDYDEPITFNEDGTMTFEDEQPDNIIINSYEQNGNNLTLTLSQRKFFSEFGDFNSNTCDGKTSFVQTFTANLVYDSSSNSFKGDVSYIRPETSGLTSNGLNCYFSSLNCSGTGEMKLE